MIFAKSSVGKQGRKCLPFMITPLVHPPFPRVITQTAEKRTHATHTHTYTKSNALLTTSQRRFQTVFRIQTQTPTYSSVRIDAGVKIACRCLCVPFYVFYVRYKQVLSKYFLNTPGWRYFLQVNPRKPCFLLADSRDSSSALTWIQLVWASGCQHVWKRQLGEHACWKKIKYCLRKRISL